MVDERLERRLLECAKELLRRHPSRRGPYIITDAQLERTIEDLEPEHG